MKKVHFSLQGKGGVGKSYVASLLAQYHLDKKLPVVCIDADPVNSTLSGYKALGAQRLDLMQGGSLIERNFDQMMEQIVSTDCRCPIISLRTMLFASWTRPAKRPSFMS